MARSDSFDAPARSGGHSCSAARADLRALCDRMFVDLAELIARVDGMPVIDDHVPLSPDERLAAAWRWWIDQQERR